MNMSAQILREIVSRVVNVNPGSVILSGELPKTFGVVATSTSGSMYGDSQSAKAYAFTPEEGLKYIKTERAYMSAAGSWANVEAYSFRHLAAMAPDALFFVIDESREINDCNGHSIDERRVTLYKAPNFKEYFQQVAEADIKRWQAWLEN